MTHVREQQQKRSGPLPGLDPPCASRVGEQGSALVLAMFILVILIALIGAAGSRVRLQVRAARASIAEVQRLYLAMAGVRLAQAVLARDDTAPDALTEEWALLGNHGRQAFALEPGSFRVEIMDAASRVNVNTATEEMLLALPGMDEALVEAILDWRESGETPRPLGAKADFYAALPEPYEPRGGPFETLGELLLVRDVTPTLLYGPPQPTGTGEEPVTDRPLCELLTVLSREPNVSKDGQPRVNLNTAGAQALLEASVGALTPAQAQAIVDYRRQVGQYASVADLLDVPGLGEEQVRALVDRVSTTSATTVDGRVNVNTASEQVLSAVPGIGPENAAQIVAAREARENGFEDLGELLAPDALDASAFRQAARYLCTRSSIFIVRAMGSVPESPAVTAVEAWVERTETGTRVLRCTKVERAPGWIAWGWPRQAEEGQREW